MAAGRRGNGARQGPLSRHVKLTESVDRFTLERLKCGCEPCPSGCNFLQFSLGWEVVQLVGLQTLESD